MVLVAMSLGGALPALLSQTVHAAGQTTVQPLSLQGWNEQVASGGTVAFIKDNTAPLSQGAVEFTTDNTDTSEAGLSMSTDTKLADVSQLSYETKQNSASFAGGDAAYRLTIDADGNTTTTNDTATLVYEPYWQDASHLGDPAPVVNGTWQTWNVADGVFWASIPAGNTVGDLSNGAGGPPFYSLSQLQSDPSLKNAVVTAVSTGIGTYNTNYNVEVDDLTFNGTTYDFEPTPGPVEDVTQNTYYDTIQEAINAARPDDLIRAKAGTYNENVTVNKSLTIEGAASGIAGYSNSRGNESTVTGSFNVTASNVTINGFTIDPASGSSVTMQGPYTNETIENNVIDDNGYAVNFNTGSTSISSNQINYGASATTGVEANSNPGNVIHFFDNHFSGDGSALPADITVIGGTPTRTEDVFVDKNTSTSGTSLVALFNTRDATISRNNSSGAQGSAIYIGGNDSYINVDDDNVITQAVTAVNVANDYQDGPNDNVTINKNNFDTTNQTGVKVGTTAYAAGTPVNATDNWWGSTSGPTDKVSGDGSVPDTNQNGTGSPAVGAVKYGPWCTLADCNTLSNVAPGTPTNLTAKFQYDSTNIANSSTLNTTAKSGGNNLELQWNAPAGWVNGYHIITTYPNGAQNTGYQGPNTNAWLVPNGFGQHGQGKYTFQVVAVNDNGESTPSASFTLYYDTQSPTASFTQAPDNNSFINGNFKVSATVSDNVRLSSAGFDVRDPSDTTGNAWRASCVPGTLTTTPDPLAGAQSATLSCTINTSNLINGHTYYVRIHASDYAGYGSPDTAPQSIRYFTFDNVAPTVKVNLDRKSYLSNGGTTGKVQNPEIEAYDTNLTEIQIVNQNGQEVTHWDTVTPGTTTYKNISWLGNGTYTIYAYDAAGNKSAGFTLTIDNTAPAVPTNLSWLDSNGNPATGGFTNAQKGVLSWQDSSAPSDVDHYVYKFWTNIPGYYDGVANAWTTDSSQYITTTSTGGSIWTNFYNDQGTYYFCVEAVDAIGNTSACSDTYTVTYDNTAPAAPTLSSPQNNSVVNGKSITQSWSDSSSDVNHYIYQSFNDASATSLRYQTTYTTTSKTATNVADGTVYWWRVAAVDQAGNVSSWSPLWKITVDNTAPVVNIIAPSDGDAVKGTVDITGTIADANPDHYYLVVKDASGKVVGGPGTVNQAVTSFSYSWDTTKLADGTYTIDLEARDAAGNKDASSVQTVNVTVNNDAPVITIGSYGTTNNVIQPNVTVTDATPTTYAWTANDSASSSNVTVTDPTDLEPLFTANASGTYSFTLTATDAAGNTSSAVFNFSYTAPTPPANTPTFTATSTTTPGGGTGTPAPVTTPLTNNGQGAVTPQVKGDSTTTPNVKGDSTVKVQNTSSTKDNNFLGLGWWWLVVLAIILGFLWFILGRRSDSNSNA